MQDKLLIITRLKKTLDYLEKSVDNYPKTEMALKSRIINVSYDILESAYKANIYKDILIMKDIIVYLRMLEYYIKKSLDKKLISFKKYEIIGNHLLEINKMVYGWINNEKIKQHI